MTSTDRRSARSQPLPAEEKRVLHTLKGFNLYVRVHQLYAAGWTLRAIGEAMTPPRTRSTISSWAEKGGEANATVPLPPVIPPTLLTPSVYVPVKAVSPGISAADRDDIKSLAPISQKYRASMSPLHPAAQSNKTLTDICTRLYNSGVPIKELAAAAGVTYRAMAKRLGRAS